MRSFFSSSSSLKVLWTHTQIKIHYPKNHFSPQWLSSKQRGFLASFYQMLPKVTTDVASQITKSLALNSFLLFTTQRKWSKAKIIFLLVNFYRESFWRCKRHTHNKERWRKNTETSLMNISRNFNAKLYRHMKTFSFACLKFYLEKSVKANIRVTPSPNVYIKQNKK